MWCLTAIRLTAWSRKGLRHNTHITASLLGRRVMFDRGCSCAVRSCAHLAATAFAAIDQSPALRIPEQQTFFGALTEAAPEKERQQIGFELAPAEPPHASMSSLDDYEADRRQRRG